jgi:hypothetical protein
MKFDNVEYTLTPVTNTALLRGITKQHHLTLHPKFKYCESNAYNNDKGEPLPMYFHYGSRVFVLKYVDGCFNPFLYEVTDAYIFSNPATGKPVIVVAKTNKQSFNYVLNKSGASLYLHEV